MFNTDRVNRPSQTKPVPSGARRRAFMTKTRTIILFAKTALNRLGFRGTATGHFHFRNHKPEDMVVYNNAQPNNSFLILRNVVHIS